MNKPVVKADLSVGIFEDFFHIKLLSSQALLDSLASDPVEINTFMNGPGDKAKYFRDNFGVYEKGEKAMHGRLDEDTSMKRIETDYGVRNMAQWYLNFLPFQDMKQEFKAVAAGDHKLPDFVLKKIEEIKQIPTELGKLQAIKHFVDSQISGAQDKLRPGRYDDYQALSQSMRSHKGDCDDYASAYAGMAREVGISPNRIMTMGGDLFYSGTHDGQQNFIGGHMITVVNIGDEMFAMDNTRSKVVPMEHDFTYKGDPAWQAYLTADTVIKEKYSHFKPFTFFNEKELYAVADGLAPDFDELKSGVPTFLAGNRPAVPK